jgi:glycosyltransferase involved in cell wall biosynthesis
MDELISVVTINYNNSEGLKKTIESVLSQNFQNLELVVVDGLSTDSSIKVIEKYKDVIDVLIVENDDGVYDAMNKGIQACSGKWINFMNSGDTFYNNDVINNIFTNKVNSNIKLIYGLQYTDGVVLSPLPLEYLEFGLIHACHQSMFFNSDIKYNLKYTIYSDYDLVARLYKEDALSLLFINQIVCNYEGGGISSFITANKRSDKYRAVFENFGIRRVLSSFLFSIASKLNKNL